MNSARRLRVPVLLTAALLALLVFTATATAETRTGESASPFNGGAPSPEATILKGSASYETTGGSVTFSVTTAAEPQVTSEAEIFAALVTARSECSPYAIFLGGTTGPIFTIGSLYEEPTAGAEMESAFGGASEYLGPAAKTVSGTTTTLSFASSKTANQSFNCVFVETFEGGEGGEGEEGGASLLAFPISAPPPPPPAPAPPAPAPPAPAPPAPAPAVLSIAKSKPLKLKADKWKKVKVKVTNTGGTATAQGSLRVKPAKGVHVKPEVQKLPVLAPGASWTVSAHVQLTAKAKKKSKLHLTATAPGAPAAKGSLVIKLKS